jgi:hypothetical protein
MNKASVLIEVVKTINAAMDNKRELLLSDPTFDRLAETAILIEGFTELRDHFQEQLEAMISAYEVSQGM